MTLDDRYQWVIRADAGVEDVMGRPRVLAVGIGDDRVILGIGIVDDKGEVSIDTRAWVRMPNHVADQHAYHLQSAAETNRQRQREL